jgi:hypothetical protein
MRKLCSSNAHLACPERMREFVLSWGKLCWYSLLSSMRGYVCSRSPIFIRAVRICDLIVTSNTGKNTKYSCQDFFFYQKAADDNVAVTSTDRQQIYIECN